MLTRARTVAVVLAVAVAIVGATSSSAATTIRPKPGTPDPRAMVLTSADVGGAKVTRQRYFKDPDFPSVISYVREFENGSSGNTPLPFVESQAEVGTSARSTATFLVALKRVFSTREARQIIAESFADSFAEEFGSDALITGLRVGRPRALGVGPDSFDLAVTARILGRPIELHIAAFRVERVLGLLTAVGAVGRRIPLTTMRRLATVMAARTIIELVPQNIALPSISGSPALNQTLAASPGRWTGNPAGYSYRWQRCTDATACNAIPGATSQRYVVQEGDVGATLRVAVSARGALTSDPATSSPTGVVAVFIDTFSASGPSSAWTAFTTGSGPAVTQANGQLEITMPAGTILGPDGFAVLSTFSNCRLPGDFDMQVEYRLLTALPALVNVGFEAAEFAGGTYSGQHGAFVANIDGTQRINTHFPNPPGAFGLPYNSFVPDSSRSGTLRLVRTTSGGVTRMTVSRITGSPWSFTSLPYAAPLPTSQAASLHLFTNVASLPSEIRVAFDNFRINSGALSCP